MPQYPDITNLCGFFMNSSINDSESGWGNMFFPPAASQSGYFGTGCSFQLCEVIPTWVRPLPLFLHCFLQVTSFSLELWRYYFYTPGFQSTQKLTVSKKKHTQSLWSTVEEATLNFFWKKCNHLFGVLFKKTLWLWEASAWITHVFMTSQFN